MARSLLTRLGLNPCLTACATRSKLSRAFFDLKVLMLPSDILSLLFPIFIVGLGEIHSLILLC